MPPLKDDIESVEAWLQSLEDGTVPAEARAAIERLILRTNITIEELKKSKAKRSALVQRLREAMGVLPKKESPPSRLAPADSQPAEGSQAEPAEGQLVKYDRFKKNRKLARKLKTKGKKKRLRTAGDKGKKAESKDESGDKPPPADPELKPITEKLSSPLPIGVTTRHRRLTVDRSQLPKGKFKSWFKRRSRWYVDLKVIREVIEVEYVEVDGQVFSAKVADFGPEGALVSWRLLTSLILAVVLGHIPVNRLASLLSGASRYFSASNIGRWLITAVADHLVGIYIAIAAELADAAIVNLDDSPALVLDIRDELQGRDTAKNRKDHQTYQGLVDRVTKEFHRQFETADRKSLKKSINLSVLIGRGIKGNFDHNVVFYRTHIGSAGDLLSRLLEMRSPRIGPLALQSDLLSGNLPKGLAARRLSIKYFGCLPHARRPFWRYRTQDPKLCDLMLKGFALLAWVEARIDETGRTHANTLKLRRRHAKKVLNYMRRVAQSVVDGEPLVGRRWPPDDPLFKGCKYLVKNYPKLIAYIDDPRLGPDNNLSERQLRADKTYLKAAGFTATEHGRIALDVLRTLVCTAKACNVSPYRYLMWVFRNRHRVAEAPENFTPHHYGLIFVHHKQKAA